MQKTNTRNKAVIAVVDDDESLRTALESLLRASGYQAYIYSGAREFLDSEYLELASCLISDVQMPGMCGVELLEALRTRGLNTPVIFITAYPGERPYIGAETPGVVACLPKPFEAEQLLDCIEFALDLNS
ncbi:response regulator [Pseudomonas guariconensis]|uniref:response regulator transcription factor n=1 Tax=Pseudomonas TaxID=286 RepID=UPI001CE41F17|nr:MULTISPECIES: response regulator [Pseudomonas]MCO7638796.1 response regulator [Pseudomonas sp. S 311-6]MCO7513349.1 response regulator [Pseudomonas putida]MCO7564517.1 response regulator [Pseudomonas mosselii]MCO7597260.1 response regulator [Pseudomonas guariconensis]MCO7604091.1 response regulator [Pseudomonas guariconensis]